MTVSIHVKTENEKLKKTAAEAEAEVIQEIVNVYLDETEETIEKHLGKLCGWYGIQGD